MTMTKRWVIERDDDAETECDNPHPVRLGRNPQHLRGECRERRDAIDYGHKGYRCPGGEVHLYTLWFVVDSTTNEQREGYDHYQHAKAECDRLNEAGRPGRVKPGSASLLCE